MGYSKLSILHMVPKSKVKENLEGKEDTYSYKGWLNSDKFLKRVGFIIFFLLDDKILIFAKKHKQK